jgi:glycosyltransferase involved in cell wall biosynthesis
MREETITLLIKSFQRKGCVESLIQSIRSRYKHVKIVVVDDSRPQLHFDHLDTGIVTYNLPFDSGISAGRNYGVSRISTPFFVLLDDDFEFTDRTDLIQFADAIESTDLDILGGQVLRRKGDPIRYFGNFYLDSQNRKLVCKREYQRHTNYNSCQIILNFFIARTASVSQCKWDEDLKVAEHAAFFFAHRNRLKIGFTETVSIMHNPRKPLSYKKFRRRGDYFINQWLHKIEIDEFVRLDGVSFKRNSRTSPVFPLKRA